MAAALSAGAHGFVTKPRISADLVPAIRQAMEGRVFVSGVANAACGHEQDVRLRP